MFRTACCTLLALLLIGGCAGRGHRGEPIVDMRGVDPANYQADLAECRQYAEQVSVGAQAGTGAVAGAVIGGVAGAVAGNSDTAKRSAGVGGIFGGASGAASGVRERQVVVRNCLRHRGYAVLN